MKRPLFWFSIFFLILLSVLLRFGGLAGLWLTGTVLLFCVLLGIWRKQAGPAVSLLLAFLLAGGVSLEFAKRQQFWEAAVGATVEFSGWVQEENLYDDSRVVVDSRFLWKGEERRLPLDLGGLEEAPAPGERIRGKALVVGCTADGGAFLGRGTVLRCILLEEEPMPVPGGFHPLSALAQKRYQLAEGLVAGRDSEDAGVVTAMIFSRSDLLSQELLEQVNRAGVRHLLVVSGLHLAILMGWARALCRALGLKKPVGAAVSLGAVWLMAAMAGFSVSVLRAAIMSTVCLAGEALDRSSDPLTSLGTAGLLLVLLSPPVVLESGFLLTFGATLGIILGATPATKELLEVWQRLFGKSRTAAQRAIEAAGVSLAAQLGTLPVLAARFGYLAVFGLLTNLLAMPFITGVVLLGGLGAVLLSAAPLAWLGQVLFFGARLLASCLLLAVRLTSALPGAAAPVRTPGELLFCCALSVCFFVYCVLRPRLKNRTARRVRRAGAALLGVGLLLWGARAGGSAAVSAHFGTGSVVIAAPSGTLVLAQGDGEYERRMLFAQLLRAGGNAPFVLVRPWDSDLNATLWWTMDLSPAALFCPEDQIELLNRDVKIPCFSLEQDPREALPGVWVSNPKPGLTLVETGGRKVLKCWTGYDIIKESDLPPDADYLVDREGRVYACAGNPAPGRMPNGDANILFYPTK